MNNTYTVTYTEHKVDSDIYYSTLEDIASRKKVIAYMPEDALITDIKNFLRKRNIAVTDVICNILKKYATPMSGVAKCHPDDEFVYETGRNLARARLLEKYYIKRLKAIRDIAAEVDKQLTHCEDQMNYSWINVNKFAKEKEVENLTFS